MSHLLKKLYKDRLINPPKWLPNNTTYLCEMGSTAYGVAMDSSDVDIYGFCVPPRSMILPNPQQYIVGFDTDKTFAQYQEHHIIDKSARKEYDFSIYNIAKYFYLVLQNNPNMIDSLFVPRNCVIHSTQVSEHLRENRHSLLHKGAWHKFKGYSYSQMHKMRIKVPDKNSKRYDDYQTHGYSTKFAYHVVRLLGEVEQILVEGDLDLQRNREQLKSIRRGEWTLKEVEEYFKDKEKSLEGAYLKSDLPHSPDIPKVRGILCNCLEIWYGDIGTSKVELSDAQLKLDQILTILNT